MPVLTSGRYHNIKWTQLADLPVSLCDLYAATQDKKIYYITGCISPVNSAIYQVFFYNINTNHWHQLPPSGHYKSISHIISE